MYFRFACSRDIFRCNQLLYGTGPFWKYSRSLSKELDLLLILTTYGRRKKREPKSYDMKLVVIDFICEVNDTGKTESYDGSVLLKALFRVRENESDSSIWTRILAIVKSRFPSFNETVLYASRQGRVVLNLSPCQTLDSKAVYTLKSKSTNNLYVVVRSSTWQASARWWWRGGTWARKWGEVFFSFVISVVQTAIFSSLMIWYYHYKLKFWTVTIVFTRSQRNKCSVSKHIFSD